MTSEWLFEWHQTLNRPSVLDILRDEKTLLSSLRRYAHETIFI